MKRKGQSFFRKLITTLFDRILKRKEELLRIGNPVEFIFSHFALGVGWDNPNIFNIATLNQSYSEIKKRQEIGRGLRICTRAYTKAKVSVSSGGV